MVSEGIAIAGTVLILYGRSIVWGLVVDDTRVEQQLNDGRPTHPMKGLDRIKYSLTFTNKSIDRVLCISIHMTVSLLIWITLGGDRIAWWTAIVFAIHPVSLSVATWLNGKRYGWNTIIVLLVNGFAPLTLPLLILVPVFQANALPTPLLFLRTHPIYIIPALATFFIFRKTFIHMILSRSKRVLVDSTRWHPRKWILMVRTLSYYLVNGIIARRVGMYHELLDGVFEDKMGERTKRWMRIDKDVILGIVLLSSFGLLMIMNWGNRIGEGLWWWFIFSLVFSNWTTITQSITDRYCYLPIIGLILAAVSIVERVGGVWWEMILIGWVGWLVVKNIKASRMYISLDEFVAYHMKEMPNASRVWVVKTNYDRNNGRRKEAFRCCIEGLRKFRWCEKLYLTGIMLLSKNSYKESCELLDKRDVNKLVSRLEDDEYGENSRV